MQFYYHLVNAITNPPILFTLATIIFLISMRTRFFWTRKCIITWLGLITCFILISLSHPQFRSILSKGDNIPIVIMVYLVSFFVWLGLYQGYMNDTRKADGAPVWEADFKEPKEFTWPDLVYIEFISTLVLGLGLLLWSMAFHAPLEEPANPASTPNPSKAPWYFLGLQEMLVYYDPWMAGVVVPTLIIIGLMAIPYIDTNPKGNGYYTFKERKTEITLFLFGFLILWCTLIFIGTFLRGPNWNFFGFFEQWNINKVLPLTNVDLSQFFWVKGLGRPLPQTWYIREAPGIILILFYYLVLPPLMAKTVLARFYTKMGFARYNIFVILLLTMLLVPLKMYLRWLFNLKYFINLQEFDFNF